MPWPQTWPTESGGRLLGMGCMRLAASPDAVEIIRAAADAGVTLFDTANVYHGDGGRIGDNERQVAAALAGRDVIIATKGGLTRPRRGRWRPDGRAKSLKAACERSLAALGRIDLYQLHAPDPNVPLATSVRALDQLRQQGMVGAIGLCNVSPTQLREAVVLADIASVQISLSIYDDEALYAGLVELCHEHDLWLLAHTPLGGQKRAAKRQRDPALRPLAERHATTPERVALAWLCDLDPRICPLPGPTRRETAVACGDLQALAAALDEDDRARLDGAFNPDRLLRGKPGDAGEKRGDVVLLVGMPGAGKSTLAAELEADGYQRLNRDERGGRVRGLLPELEAGTAAGVDRWIVDNTFPSRALRRRFVVRAARLGLAARCIWLDTPLFEAQINAVRRLLRRYGGLPDDLAELAKTDPHAFLPQAQFRFERAFDPPAVSEGFGSVERRAFQREAWDGDGAATFIQSSALRSAPDGKRPRNADEVNVDPAWRKAVANQSGRLVVFGWLPGCEASTIAAIDARTRALLDRPELEILTCPHPAGPPACWCRTPLPGLVVSALDMHQLDPARCTLVGDSAPDRTLAERLGMTYVEASDWLAAQP